MMIAQQGIPPYTHGSWIIYGCPECGTLEFAFDPANVDGNPLKTYYDPFELRNFAVSN